MGPPLATRRHRLDRRIDARGATMWAARWHGPARMRVDGARIVAGRLITAVARRQALAVARRHQPGLPVRPPRPGAGAGCGAAPWPRRSGRAGLALATLGHDADAAAGGRGHRCRDAGAPGAGRGGVGDHLLVGGLDAVAGPWPRSPRPGRRCGLTPAVHTARNATLRIAASLTWRCRKPGLSRFGNSVPESGL
jgi:hypothetical protein